MFDFLHSLLAVDWSTVVGAAVASGAGLTAVTQLLKTKWVAVPARKYPRIVTAVLAVLVGIIGTLASGIELSSISSLVVFAVVSFVVSGLTYDGVRGLVGELKADEAESVPTARIHLDHTAPGLDSDVKEESSSVNSLSEKLTVEQVAQQIVDGVGDWGNGAARRDTVRDRGYNYSEVQARVKELVAKQ